MGCLHNSSNKLGDYVGRGPKSPTEILLYDHLVHLKGLHLLRKNREARGVWTERKTKSNDPRAMS